MNPSTLSGSFVGALIGVALVFGRLSVDAAPLRSGEPQPGSAAPLSLGAALPLPKNLSETGLYASGSTTEIHPEAHPYSPQYPLWTDGAAKRRWLRLPEGKPIDATDPDDWQFPVGTRLWKEFSFGRRVETRYMERLPGGDWRLAAYVWNEAGTEATLAPEAGVLDAAPLAGSQLGHDVPARADCMTCHGGRRSPVLGVSALQLSTDRDTLAPHAEKAEDALDLAAFFERRLIVARSHELLERPPRITAPSPEARAALGYFYGNCSGCHNATGPLASVGLDFDWSVARRDEPAPGLTTTIDRPSQFRMPSASDSLRIAPGHPEKSAVWFRLSSRDASRQMPPLGTHLVDQEAVELVGRFIRGLAPAASIPGRTARTHHREE